MSPEKISPDAEFGSGLLETIPKLPAEVLTGVRSVFNKIREMFGGKE